MPTQRSTFNYALSILLLLAAFAPAAPAETRQTQPTTLTDARSPAIVVAFIGGLLHHKVEHYQDLAQRLTERYGDDIRVEIVFNGARDRRRAMRSVRSWLDSDGDKQISEDEKRHARIALFGHSYGATAEMAFARQLQRENIPVALTIQVDDIEKLWESGRVVPANVAAAINFYQRHGVLRGLSEIKAEDPAHTRILGNFEVPFDPAVAANCKDYSRFLRAADKYHIAIECDPKIGARVETLLEEYLFPHEAPSREDKGRLSTQHTK